MGPFKGKCKENRYLIRNQLLQVPKVLIDVMANVNWSCPQTHATVHSNIRDQTVGLVCQPLVISMCVETHNQINKSQK